MPNEDSALAAARERVENLRATLQSRQAPRVVLIETHISWVLLGESLAYKLKKPVKLPFLDFTTLPARRKFCEEEVRLNQRLASALYLDVVDVCDSPDGAKFGGAGEVLDVAVRMHRFPDGALWSEMLLADTLKSCHIDAMARRLADFHRDADVAPAASSFGSFASHKRVVHGLIDIVEAPALKVWLHGQLHALKPLWTARRHDGRVRECHGDLHLGNVLQLFGQAAAFDGIEFDARMRWIDVVDDIAFLAMDLLANGRPALAHRFINAYFSATGDYAGLRVLRFSMVCRALVRAQVTAIAERQGVTPAAHRGATRYLALASALSRGFDARLAITHGLPGSGKSFVAQHVLEAAGAVCVRSDVERKRLFGFDALARSRDIVPSGIYNPSTTRRTYARLHQAAELALKAGWPVIVDAAFLLRSERESFSALAASRTVPFSIFDCRAKMSLLHQRIKLRRAGGGDASEADAAVLDRLSGANETLDDRERAAAIVIDAAAPVQPETLAVKWLAIV